MGRGPVSAGRVSQVISGHAACAPVPRSHVRWLGDAVSISPSRFGAPARAPAGTSSLSLYANGATVHTLLFTSPSGVGRQTGRNQSAWGADIAASTHGRFQPFVSSNAFRTLLPELAKDLARKNKLVSHQFRARSEYFRGAPRVPAPSGSQAAMAAGDNPMVMSPRQTSARSEAAQFWTWYCVLYVGWTLDFIHPVWSAPSQPHSGFVHQRLPRGWPLS